MDIMNRILINDENNILTALQSDSIYVDKLSDYETWSIEDFENKIKETENTVFYVCGHEFYESLRKMNDSGILHLGLRNFDFLSFQLLQWVYIGTNRLVFDPCKDFYRYEAEEGKKTKKWLFDENRMWDRIQNQRPRLDLFLSDEVEREYLKYPKTQIVGLREGKEVLRRLDKYTKHKYKSAIDYDWYRNPDHLVWENEFGFDFETFNSNPNNIGLAFPEYYGVRCAGFALSWSDPYTKQNRAIFFDFRKDYQYDEDKWENDKQYKKEYYEFLEVMKTFFDNHAQHCWAYNASFEVSMLFHLLRKFYRIQDSYALCIAHDCRSNLKFNTQYLLRSPSWDDDLDADFDYFRQICNNFKNFEEFEKYCDEYDRQTEKNESYDEVLEICKDLKSQRKDIEREIRREHGWKAKDNKDDILKEFKKTKLYKKIEEYESRLDFYDELGKKDPRFEEALVFFGKKNPIKRMLLKQHWGDEWGATGVGKNYTEYGTQEENCLGLYCGIDSFVGERLGRLLMPAYGNNCYQEFLNHKYMGSELKMGGIRVDKKRLLDLYRFIWNLDNNYEYAANIFTARKRLRELNPMFKDWIKDFNDFQTFMFRDVSSWWFDNRFYLKDCGLSLIMQKIKELYQLEDIKSIIEKYFEIYDEKVDIDEILEYYKFNIDKKGNVKTRMSKDDCIDFFDSYVEPKLHLYKYNSIINTQLYEIVKDKAFALYEEMKPYWIFEDTISLEDAIHNGLFEMVNKSDGSLNYELIQETFEFTDEMIEQLQILPSDMLEKFQSIPKISYSKDKKKFKKWAKYSEGCYSTKYDTLLSKSESEKVYFVTQLDFEETIENWYSSNKILNDDYDSTINVTECLTSRENKNEIKIYPKEQILNYFSSTQIDEYYYSFGNNKFYYDTVLAIRSAANCIKNYYEYMKLPVKELKESNPIDLWKGILEYLNNEEYRNIILNEPKFCRSYIYTKQDMEELKEDGTPKLTDADTNDYWEYIDPASGYNKIDIIVNDDSWWDKDALENTARAYKIIPYITDKGNKGWQDFKLDCNILPPITDKVIEELSEKYDKELITNQCHIIWEVLQQAYMRKIGAVANKILTTYIPAIDEGRIKFVYKENLNNTGKDTVYGQWEIHNDYSLSAANNKGRNSIVDRKGIQYLFSKECEEWFVNELPDLWCLPPYSINTVKSKRNSSS